jgi:Aspartyl protease
MQSYDASHFQPPAPATGVTLRNPSSPAVVSGVPMLLDTGADITLLPRTAVERLGVAVLADSPFELMGFDGTKSYAPAAMLDMIFMKRVFRGRYLLTQEERGVLGRDFLNHLTLVLDGPRQQCWEHSR